MSPFPESLAIIDTNLLFKLAFFIAMTSSLIGLSIGFLKRDLTKKH